MLFFTGVIGAYLTYWGCGKSAPGLPASLRTAYWLVQFAHHPEQLERNAIPAALPDLRA
jgi:hypothetical protein